MPIKMQHAVFDDSSIQYAFWYVCNMHELRWNFFFVQGVLVPGGQPNLWVSASLNHKLVPHQITAPCFSQSLPGTRGRRANIRDILSTTSFKPRPPVGLQSLWEQCQYIYILSQCKLMYSACWRAKQKTDYKNILFQYNDVVLVRVRMCLSALQ